MLQSDVAMKPSHRTRFAPSPTGFLHLGHVVSACHARDMAGPAGEFLIRIEDIDQTRCRPAFEQATLEDLDWLGIRTGLPIRRQSDHLADYRATLDALRARGLVYPCTCTRTDVMRHGCETAPDGSMVYPGTCRDPAHRVEDRPSVWRLDMGRALDLVGEPGWLEEGRGRVASCAAAFGDVVLGRRDSGVSYHLCVTHDDAQQGIDLVTRGMDLFAATSVHRVLQCLCGWPEPAYAHHQLVCDADGRKLSKRDGAAGIRTLRETGVDPQTILTDARALYSGGYVNG